MKKYYLILLLVCQFTCSDLFAATYRISKIRFQGLNRVSKEAVLHAIPIKTGQSIGKYNSAEIVRAVFKTGFFSNVVLQRSGNDLVINVKERPTIARLDIRGIKNKDDVQKILKEANIHEGRVYDEASLIKAEQDIEHLYLSKGNYAVKVKMEISKEDLNRVSVVAYIYTGYESKIKQVNITGNSAFSEKVLLKQILHSRTNWLSWLNKGNRYAKEKHIAELEMLQGFYLDRGYVNFQVDSSQVSLSTDKKDVYITINVTEGEKYYFGKIKLIGKFVVPKEHLQQIVDRKLQDKMVFSRKLLLDVQNDLEMYLGNYGYGNAQAKINVDNDEKAKKINIEYLIDPGDRITVRRINIVGNRLTKDRILRYGIEQTEGSWISKKNIQDAKEYMMREGYASNVEIEHKPVLGKKDQVDVLYTMEEQRTTQFSGGIAYSGAEKFMYNFAADFRNFLGTGKNINLSFDKSRVTESYSFGYFNPFFTVDGIGMGYNLYKNKVNVSKTSNIFDFGVNSIGGDVNWSLPLSKNDYFLFGIGVDKSEVNFDISSTSTPTEAIAFVRKHGRDFHEYSVTIGWRHNTLDRFIFPTKGLFQKLILKSSLPNSTLKYYSINYENSWYYPVTNRYVVNLSSNVGYMANYNKSQYFPFFKHYYAGGADSIRGYEERSLGPLDSKGNPFGGNVLLTGKAAVISPLPFYPDAKSVRTSLFMEAGQVYDTNYKHIYNSVTGDKLSEASRNPQGLRYSVGVSFIWNSPLGAPIVISFAKALNAKEADRTSRFSLNFATKF